MKVDTLPSAIQSGLQGYQTAERGVADAAAQINKLNTEQDRIQQGNEPQNLQESLSTSPPVSLTTEAVNLIVNEHLAKASVKVIATADEMMGTLIDTKV